MPSAPWGRWFSLAALLTGLSWSAAAQGVVIGAPPGFETAEEDDRTFVDVLIKGRRVAQTPVRFNSETLIFEDPVGLTNLLPMVRDKDRIAGALSRSLPTHMDHSCKVAQPRSDCGYVYPDEVALIFDPKDLTVDLFINDLYTYDRDPRARHLPPPTASPGLITRFNTRTSYDYERGNIVGTQNMRAIAGFGRHAVRADLFANSNSQTRLNALYATHTGKRLAWSAGLQRQQFGGGVANSRQLLGVRYGTTLDTRLDRSRLSASKLDISVAQSATIEIQRDGQTLDVQQIEPGQDALDTSRLPSGAYSVDLVIDEGGTVRTESRFFSSSTQLPPSDTAQWFVEFGQAIPFGVRDGFVATGETPILSFGRHQRIGSNIALKLDGTLTDDIRFAEVSTTLQADGFNGTASVLASDDGTFGYAASGSARFFGWQVYSAYRALDLGSNRIPRDSDAYDPFPNDFKQASISANRSGRWGRMGLRGFYRENSSGRESWFGGPYVDVVLLNRKRWRLNALLRQEWGSDRNSSFVGVRLSKAFNRPHDRIRSVNVSSRIDSNLIARRQTGETNDITVAETEIRADLSRDRVTRVSAFAGIRHDDETGTRAGFNYTSPWLDARLDARHQYQRQNSAFIDLRSGFAIGGHGISLTASRYESGAQVALQGPPGSPIGVQVDQRTQTIANSGSQAFLPLQSFSIYDIGIQPERTADVAYTQSTDRLVAYPGNIVQLAKSVRPITIIIGQIVDPNRVPIPEVSLSYEDQIIGRTDSAGFFQIDGSPGDVLTVRFGNDQVCSVSIPNRTDGALAYFDTGQLSCE